MSKHVGESHTIGWGVCNFAGQPMTGVLIDVNERNLEHILSTNFVNYRKGELFNKLLKEFFGRGMITVDGEEWRFHQKIVSHVFTSRNVKNDMTAVFVKNAALLVDKLKKYAETGEVFDMQDLYMRYTLESFAEIAFGEQPGLLSGTDEHAAEWTNASMPCKHSLHTDLNNHSGMYA
jgi:cytochrome P450